MHAQGDDSVIITPEILKLALASVGITRGDYGESDSYSIDLEGGPKIGGKGWRAVLSVETKQWKLRIDGFDASSRSKDLVSFDSAIKPSHKKLQAEPVDVLASDVGSPLASRSWAEQLNSDPSVDFFKSVDWTSSPLGALSTWPKSLRVATSFLLADPRPAVIFWGLERVPVYNLHYSLLVGSLHPALMGSPFRTGWPELWPTYEMLWARIEDSGKAMLLGDFELCLQDRNGYLEEVWYNSTMLPWWGEDCTPEGIYVSCYEVTRQVLNDRRLKVVNALALRPNLRVASVWQHIIKALELDEKDITMAALYSADAHSIDGCCKVDVQATIGLSLEDAGTPIPDLRHSKAWVSRFLQQASDSHKSVVLDVSESLPSAIIERIQWKGFREASKQMVVIPLTSTDDSLHGFLLLGLNSRKLYDSDYQNFIRELERQLCTTMASLVTFEQAKQREVRLSKDLAESEKRIRQMTELAPVGMWDINAVGNIVFANPQYFEICGIPSNPEERTPMSFLDSIHDDSRADAETAWTTGCEKGEPFSVALKLKRKVGLSVSDSGPTGYSEQNVWIHAGGYPNRADGSIESVMGTVVDITRYKWAESVQARSAEDARNARRIQEEFIDWTSHEMRNPLSAIMQCGDTILQDCVDYTKVDTATLFTSIADAAATILMCVAHQRRIIDDILMVSKLDSNMIPISPTLTRPSRVVYDALKMFEAEFKSADIEVEMLPEPLHDQTVNDLVLCDSSRLTQIFINLLTNAIKFTRTESKRKITVRFGTSDGPPSDNHFANLHWFPTHKKRKDLTQQTEWGGGDPRYLHFAVQDSGRGLQQDEMMRLFTRFTQASRKTHVKYGGSGLGLFISRELTEMHGGEIGLASRFKEGSTFAFYIKTRKATGSMMEHPQSPSEHPKVFSVERRSHSAEAAVNSVSPRPELSQIRDRDQLRLLLVEDNIINQTVLSKQLRKAGHVVFVADHGAQALEILRTTSLWQSDAHESNGEALVSHHAEPPASSNLDSQLRKTDIDCILMDVEMPVMDGLTCTRKIRALEQQGYLVRHINIIAITANARSEQVQRTMQAGVDDVMPKPFKVAELLSKIKQLDRTDAAAIVELST